uniref:Ubiquitin fusion degradation protein 1 homolog n=1 Tax=Homalodisca liturata TaxID=320908 RepID=A0A1B6HJF9_9HEMI
MFSFNIFGDIPRTFNKQYQCYSVAMLPGNEREDVEKGGKIIMPPSALDHLTQLNITYPMLFKLTNRRINRVSHCGVLEFVADEGNVYLPRWMMHNLLLEEGDLVSIENILLPVASFAKFQPQSSDFLDITNPKAVLENSLRNYACLTTGDVIAIMYNKKTYEVCVLETKPGNAVCIIECDMNVEFSAPVGYEEPKKVEKEEDFEMDETNLIPEQKGFVAFTGEGNILDENKKKKINLDGQGNKSSGVAKVPYQRGIPDYNYTVGTLQFIRNNKPPAEKENKEPTNDFKPFFGSGQSLRRSKN